LMLVPLLVIPSMVSAVNFVMDIDVRMVSERLSQFIQSLSTAVQANPALAAVFQPILDSLKMTIDNFLSTSQSGVTNLNISVDEITSRLGDVLGTLARFLGPTFSAIVSIFFTFLMSVQMTLTADGMRSWYADLIPPGYGPELAFMVTKIRKTWVGFLRGQMSLMLIIGVVTWLGASILGLRQALFLGIIAGIMELIPNIGPTIAAVPAVALALLFGSTHLAIDNFVFALIVVAFYVLVQLAENQLLVPNIMGDAVDLPPLVVLIGTIAGAGAFGIMGALLATPVIATGNLVFRYVYRKIIEDQPMAPPVEEKADIWGRVKGLASRFTHTLSRVKQPAAAQSKEMVPTTQKQK
jgi:predicted PurR-regulated permease PerM